MLLLSSIFAAVSAVAGYWSAVSLDASIAGSIAGANGVIFLLTFLFSPKRGIVAVRKMRARQRWEFAMQMLSVHLLHHEGTEHASTECRRDHLTDHINWTQPFADQVIHRMKRRKLVDETGAGRLTLTEKGTVMAHDSMQR
jgi:manganese/zinc/iron transport system permease protein